MEFAHEHPEAEACEYFNITPETIARYKREARIRGLSLNVEQSAVMKQIVAQYSDSELKAIAKGGRVMAGMDKVPIVDFSGQKIRIGAISDTHIGSIYTNPDYLFQAYEQFEKEGVEFVAHSGDVTEGMSHRAGHVFECSEIGYSAQKKKAIELLGDCPFPLYVISGNHDFWYMKSNGANIVQDICDEIGATYLGHDEGDINLKGKATLKLWHGLDGSSYALSYRLQKMAGTVRFVRCSPCDGNPFLALRSGRIMRCPAVPSSAVHTPPLGGSLPLTAPWLPGYPLRPRQWRWGQRILLMTPGRCG